MKIVGKASMIFFQYNKITAKKLLKMKLAFSADYDSYVSEYLMAMKSTNNDKFFI